MMKNALEFAIGFKGTKGSSQSKLGPCLRAPLAAATTTPPRHRIQIRTAGGRELTAEVAPAGHVSAEHPLDRDAWTRLLSFLEITQPGPAGRAYERTRERLVRFFKTRGSTHAEELADASLDRVARKLARETIVDVRNPMGYVLGVARLIWLERVKSEMSQRNRHGHYEETRMIAAEDALELERNSAILDRCLAEMPADERALLLSYHQGRGQACIANRQELGQSLGINPGLLRTRVHRLRTQLGRRVDELLSVHERQAV